MADPVVFDSSLSVFKITDTGAVERDLTDYIVNLEGLPGPRELSEATTLNQTGRKYHPSLQNATIILELVYSEDALVGTDTVLGPLRTYTAAVAFKYYPRGVSGVYYSGDVWVRDYRVVTRVGDIVRCRCELQVHGVPTRNTP
jgi:hypothetical protein